MTLRKQNAADMDDEDLYDCVTGALRTIRGGGCDLDTKRAVELVEETGCTSVHAAPRTGPVPLELVLGQKPMSS